MAPACRSEPPVFQWESKNDRNHPFSVRSFPAPAMEIPLRKAPKVPKKPRIDAQKMKTPWAALEKTVPAMIIF